MHWRISWGSQGYAPAGDGDVMKRRAWQGLSFLVLSLVFLQSPQAVRAGIEIADTIVMSVGDPHYQYQYTLTLSPGDTISNGNYLTIYDIPGINGLLPLTRQVPAGLFTVTSQPTGLDPLIPPAFFDDPAIDNLTLHYVGPTQMAGITPLFLTDFSLLTNDSFPFPPPPVILATQHYGSQTTGFGSFYGTTTARLVPEPASLGLLAAGGSFLVLLRRRAKASHGHRRGD
jgi:hypothetical protein